MKKPSLGPMKRYDTIDHVERRYIETALHYPLSGYLGGEHKGGYWIQRLSEEWAETFSVNHAIPCNSATSGLLAACMAAGIGHDDLVWTSVYTMSATAACARVLGARVEFIDIEPKRFSINMSMFPGGERPKAIIVTNLFGHPAHLVALRAWCNAENVVMIEDNAQGAFAIENQLFAGTIGHMGVFSLNVHKQLQVGEGGVVVTNDDSYALKVKDAINHGELRGGITGLNLRMTEIVAAMAVAQLEKGTNSVTNRRELALEMTDMVLDIPAISPPAEAPYCTSSYYIWAAKVWPWKRTGIVAGLNERGLPVRAGYSMLLSDIFQQQGLYPIARSMEDKELMTFEICAYTPSRKQRKIMREIFRIVGWENYQ